MVRPTRSEPNIPFDWLTINQGNCDWLVSDLQDVSRLPTRDVTFAHAQCTGWRKTPVSQHKRIRKGKEMFYLSTHSTHFIYGYIASDIWIMREETCGRHMGYSFRLTTRWGFFLICTTHGLCNTSRGSLAGTGNSSMGPPHEGSIRRPIAP